MSHVIRIVRFPEETAAVRELFQRYQAEIGVDLCFQNFAAELRELPGAYAAPAGFVLGVESAKQLVGCVALRPLQPGVAEMKRLYVEPEQRGAGLARRLVLELIERARALHYRRIVLDTLPIMVGAQHLYGVLGFTDIEAYTCNPTPGARCMALALG